MGINASGAAVVSRRDARQAAIERARAKAVEQASCGNVPTLLRSRFDGAAIVELWSLGSRTTGGRVYLVDLRHDAAGVTTCCDCAASDADRLCWHRASARMAHNDEIRFTKAPRVLRFRPLQRTAAPARPRVTAAELSLQPAYV